MARLRLLLLLSVLSASAFPAAASSSPSSSSPSARRRRLVSARNPNIETFFPSDAVPAFSNPPAPPPPPASVPLFAPRRSSKGSVAAAVVATAAGTFVVSGLFFFALHWFVFKQRGVENDYDQGNKVRDEGGGGGAAARRNPYRPSPVNGTLKAVVVDEDGLDVLYWRKLEDGDPKRCAHCRRVIGGGAEAAGGGEGGRNGSGRSEARSARRPHREYSRPVQEAPLLMDDSLSSSDRMTVVLDMLEDRSSVSTVAASTRASVEAVVSSPPSLPLPPGWRGSKTPSPASPSSSLPPPPAAVRPSPPPSSSAVASPPKPPSAPPPPRPPAAAKSVPAPPAPPPPRPSAGGKKPPGPPAPPPAPGGARSGPSPFRPPGIPRSNSKSTGEESTQAPAKLKPLHWDKMNTVHAQHSMIWDKIGGGSFRVDDDMMEVLFGYVAGRKSPKNSSSASENPFGSAAGGAPTQICLLDPRKSQNTAIVLKSLAVTRREIMDALVDGHGLSSDTLEKLSKLAPSKEEEDSIVRFSGNPSSLADAECFLFHLLRDLPSAFARVETMLFKASYEPEVVHLRAALQSLEAACEELRRRGLFWKMLEAVLKAGNRMNAGTARGNAQAFNLTSLRKLSDVRSTDGKTTLLHFVVESVVRNEGKRCVVNRIHSFGRSASRSAAAAGGGFSSSTAPGAAPTRGEKEMEYLTLGLPIVGGLSVEFANVKKAAGIDHDALASTCPALDTRAARARRVLAACGGSDGGGGFAGEIGGFLERAEEELKALREEQARVLELVKKTTEYYMLGAAQDKSASPLQLFVIVKDFLVLVDQACVDIARRVQQQKRRAALSGAASPKTPEKRAPARFPNLPERFMSENSRSSSSGDSGSNSDSEDEGL